MPSRVPLLFGSAVFGDEGRTPVRVTDTKDAQVLLDLFFKNGHMEIDSARLYGDGTTEVMLGKLDLRGAVVDTKINPSKPGDHSPEKLRATLDISIKALHPHEIRILYLHAPDRSVPFTDTLREINALHEEGKFEAFGLSNFPAWEVVEVIHICKANGWLEPTVYQGPYNAITRTIEPELIPCARKFGLRLIAYNPLAGGFFTGRINSREDKLDDKDTFNPANGWLGPILRKRYLKDGHLEALKVVQAVAEKHNITIPEIGHRWLQHHSLLSPGDGIVIGGSSVAHIQQNIDNAAKGPLPDEVVEALDVANKIVGADAPLYYR